MFRNSTGAAKQLQQQEEIPIGYSYLWSTGATTLFITSLKQLV